MFTPLLYKDPKILKGLTHLPFKWQKSSLDFNRNHPARSASPVYHPISHDLSYIQLWIPSPSGPLEFSSLCPTLAHFHLIGPFAHLHPRSCGAHYRYQISNIPACFGCPSLWIFLKRIQNISSQFDWFLCKVEFLGQFSSPPSIISTSCLISSKIYTNLHYQIDIPISNFNLFIRRFSGDFLKLQSPNSCSPGSKISDKFLYSKLIPYGSNR